MAGVRTLEAAQAAWMTATLSTGIAGGSGGGGAGDGTNTGGGGGGGGAAGGFLFIVTNRLEGAGVFSAPGGNGGNGAAGTGGNAAGGAGGGGGGGGIAIVSALDYADWTGTVVAPGGNGGAGGAGVGTGTAGANGTAGSAGTAVLLNLATVDTKTRADVKAIVTPSVTTTAPLLPSPVVYNYDQAPVRFVGGPKETKTYGGITYYQSGLQTGNNGWNGPSGGGGFWIMEYVTDAPVHEIRLRNANGKMRLKVDGKFVNDTTVLTYTSGGAQWYQVSFGKSRRFRHFEWQLNQAPFNAIAIGPQDTLYPPRTKRQFPTYILGDSFTEGAIGLTQGATDHFKSWAFQLCELMGWDHPMIDGEGGTGYVNDSGIDAPYKKPFPQRIVDDVAPLPEHLRPKQVVVAGGFNDPTNTQSEKDAFSAAATLTFQRLADELPGVPVWVVMFVNVGNVGTDLQTRRDLLKAAALAAPNVVAFIDTIAGTWFPGPLCDVPGPDEPGVAWNTGTGHIGAPTGTGNSDLFRSADLIHPSPAGHEMLASRVAAAITQSLPA
jgi:lysophospholipase L1-like esterase